MKRSRFTEEQIIGILREEEAGATGRRGVEQAQGILVAALGVQAGWYGYGRSSKLPR